MLIKIGVIFTAFLVLSLISNINYNASAQPIILNASNTNATTPITASPITAAPVSNVTKLDGGIKITQPERDSTIPLNANNSMTIKGVSKDNALTNCTVSIIINNVKPYQPVQPTGTQGKDDYSTWQYKVTKNYTDFKPGSNKITSKIYCLTNNQPSQAYYSVNATASNFTAAQLSSYNAIIDSNNLTNSSSSNVIPVVGGQPTLQTQQLSQAADNTPICCQQVSTSSAGSSSSSGSGGSSSGSSSNHNDNNDNNDNHKSSSSSNHNDNNDNNDNHKSSSSSNHNDFGFNFGNFFNDNHKSSSSSNHNDNNDNNDNHKSSRSHNNDFGSDNNDNGGSGHSRGSDLAHNILHSVENNLRSSGIDFSFD